MMSHLRHRLTLTDNSTSSDEPLISFLDYLNGSSFSTSMAAWVEDQPTILSVSLSPQSLTVSA